MQMINEVTFVTTRPLKEETNSDPVVENSNER